MKETIREEVVFGTVLIVIGIWILSRGKSTLGEKNIKLGVSVAVLAAITPVLSSLIALFTLKEKLNVSLVLGTSATITGIWIIL